MAPAAAHVAGKIRGVRAVRLQSKDNGFLVTSNRNQLDDVESAPHEDVDNLSEQQDTERQSNKVLCTVGIFSIGMGLMLLLLGSLGIGGGELPPRFSSSSLQGPVALFPAPLLLPPTSPPLRSELPNPPPQPTAQPPPSPMPLHPFPSPSMPFGASIVASINSRWATGFASNNLSQAGLLIHTFDNVDGDSVRDNLWLPCQETLFWCRGYEVASASIVNKDLPHYFNEDGAGIIFSASAISPSSIRCAFAYDAGTMGDPSGCPGPRCDDSDGFRTYCHWGADQLRQMLEQHADLHGSGNERPCGQDECDYNEVVIDADHWTAALPNAIEAFVFPRHSRDAEWRARDVMADFRDHFGNDAYAIPLVSFDRSLMNTDAPFELVDKEQCCVSPEY